MYIPEFNRLDDAEAITRFMDAHGFATVISTRDGVPFASHLPVLYESETRMLHGHMARANDQWRHFGEGVEVLCIFHGPHSYVSPSWYASKTGVPTWNYAAVHAYGIPKVTSDPVQIRRIVDATTAKYEKPFETPWVLNLPSDTVEKLLKAVVGFSVKLTRVEAKLKLGQNRSMEDQVSLIAALESRPDPDSKSLATMLRAHLAGDKSRL